MKTTKILGILMICVALSTYAKPSVYVNTALSGDDSLKYHRYTRTILPSFSGPLTEKITVYEKGDLDSIAIVVKHDANVAFILGGNLYNEKQFRALLKNPAKYMKKVKAENKKPFLVHTKSSNQDVGNDVNLIDTSKFDSVLFID